MEQRNDMVIVPEASKAAGAVTYWKLAGELSLDRLELAWREAGLDTALLPTAPSDEVAIRRAVAAQATKRRLVRPLAVRGHWAIVDEVTVGRRSLDWEVTLRVRFEKREGDEDGSGTVYYEPNDHTLVEEIRKAFHAARGQLTAHDVSVWLVGLVNGLQAVGLRDKGGVYFVPKTSTETWNRMADAIERASESEDGRGIRIFGLPAIDGDSARLAILDAITTEAAAEAAAIEAELGDLGSRALATRGRRAQDLLGKVETYEGLLGTRLDSTRDRLDALRAAITTAILAVEAEKQEAA